jgi:hypothetical protein
LNGYLFAPGDINDLTRLMGQLANQSQHWAEMGTVSRGIALQHDLDMIIHKYESLYTTLIGEIPVTNMDKALKGIT